MAIFTKLKGHVFPTTLLDAAAKFEQKAWGVAVLKDGDLVPLTASVTKAEEAISTAEFAPIQEQYKDIHLLLTMDGGTNTILEEDLQPFQLLTKNKQVLLVGALDGEFPQYALAGSSRTNHANMVEKFLRPKLERLFKKSGEGMASLMEEVRGEDFKADVENACYPGGTVVLLANDGSEPVIITKNANAKRFPFGFLTNTFGLKEDTFPPKAEGGLSKLAQLRAARAAATPAPTGPSKEDIKAEPTPAGEPKSMPDAVAQTESDKKEDFVWVVPKEGTSAKNKGKWYYKVCSFLQIPIPEGAKEKNTPLKVPLAYFKATIHNSSTIVAAPQHYVPLAPPEAEPGKVGDLGEKIKEAAAKDTSSKHIPLEVIPVLSNTTKEWLRKGLTLQPKMSAESIQALEKKHANFFEISHKWNEICEWPFANFVALAEDKAAVALLCWTLAAKLRNIEPALSKTVKTLLEERRAM